MSNAELDAEIQRIRDHIRSRKLPPPVKLPPPDEHVPHLPPPQPKAGEREAYVNRRQINSLDEDLPVESKENSLWWPLYAQLWADIKLAEVGQSFETHPNEWYTAYVLELRGIGMLSRNHDRGDIGQSNILFTVDATILRLLAAFLNPTQLGKIKAIIEALDQQAADGALTLFDQRSTRNGDSNFQISDGAVDSQLNLTITAGYYNFTTHQTVTRMLFWEWTDRDIRFFAGNDTLTLSKRIADEVREDLFQSIKEHIVGNIRPVPGLPPPDLQAAC